MRIPPRLMLPEPTQSLHPIYTLSKVPEGEMDEMDCKDEMVEMEPQGNRERGETLVCRDHLAHKVYKSMVDNFSYLSTSAIY